MSSSRLLALVGGIVLIFGAAVPWSGYAGVFGPFELGSINGLGLLTAVCGLIVVVIAAVQHGYPGLGFSLLVIIAAVAAIGVLALAFLMLFAIAAQNAPGMVLTQIGIGWYISFIGAGLSLLGAAGPILDTLSRSVPSDTAGGRSAAMTGGGSELQHDVRRFCQMMWPQPDPHFWTYGLERYSAAAEYLTQAGLLARIQNGYQWRYPRDQVTRWLIGR